MSGKCYSIEDMLNQKEIKTDRAIYSEIPKENNDGGLNKLLEYEKLASLAEEKCIILRSELERVKQMYNNRNEVVQNSNNNKQQVHNKGSNPSCKRDKGKSDNVEIHPLEQFKQPAAMGKQFYKTMIRQNSNAIRTDMSGAALNTVNNIIDGITESIHFPDFPMQMQKNMSQIHGVQQIKLNTRSNQQTQTKTSRNIIDNIQEVLNATQQNMSRNTLDMQELLNTRPKRLLSRYSSKTLALKKNKKVNKFERKLKPNDSKSNVIQTSLSLVNKRSRKTFKRQRPWSKMSTNRLITKPADLVEIYHNVAVKDSNSSENNNNEGRIKTKRDHPRDFAQIVPPLNMNLQGDVEYTKKDTYNISQRGLTTLSRNYELPTIASRLKQVAKYYYMNSSCIKVIPFCPASSTTPSHNIGINIQQVMSMVKTKQPFKEISPTLVHNIGLAADKWKNKPLPFLVTTVTSRVGSRCPLLKGSPNYKQMQEMAKLIPEDIAEENVEQNENDTPNEENNQSVVITGPSGDMKVSKRAESVWTVNSNNTERCTCVPEKGVNLQQMISKYKVNYAGSTIGSQIVKFSPRPAGLQAKTKINKIIYTPENIKPENVSKDKIKENIKETCNKENLKENLKLEMNEKSTEDKEKKLKTVLTKLHNEFDTMQKRYEELSNKKSTELTQEQTKEMDRLDAELNSKEEEIVMVMGLYREVLALKQQVKNLKERASRDSVVVKEKSLQQYNNSTAVMHLNKLLRQVQYYQNLYKKA